MKVFVRRPISTELLLYCLEDEPTSAALRYLAVLPPTWVSLYQVLEVIQDDMGGKVKLLQTRWISRTALNRFTQTANSPAAVGRAARHGRQREQPPLTPMTMEEARSHVLSLVEAWLSSKHESFGAQETVHHASANEA